MPARTVHLHCCAVTWLSSCLFTSAPEVAMIQVTPPPVRRLLLKPPVSVATLPLASLLSHALHVHPKVLQSLHIRLAGVGRYDQAYLRDVGDDAEAPLFELPAVDEQHGTLGLPDHRPLDLGFERVDVREIPLGRDPFDADESPPCHVRLDRVYRARSYEREGERPVDPTKTYHTRPRGIHRRKQFHYRHQVGQAGEARPAGQYAPRRVVCRTRGVDKHGLLRLQERRGGAGEPLFLFDRLPQPLVEGVLVLRESGRNGSTMGPLYLPPAFEHREIPPRRGRRDAKLFLQPGYRDAPRLAYEHRYPLLPLLR